NHPYAVDIDLFGPGSLFQRLDVTHTRLGEATLANWLAAPAGRETILARQQAVDELAARVDLRRELEVASGVDGSDKLDAGPFLEFTRHPSVFSSRPWLAPVIHVLP